jgi:rhodanese-related sulfurtransferase
LQKQKEQGRQIISTALSDRSVSMLDIDWTKPTTLVIGNEKDGVTQEAMDLSDELCIIPTVGFSQSFNLSVAAAILLNHIHLERSKANLNQGDLSDEDFLFQKVSSIEKQFPETNHMPIGQYMILSSAQPVDVREDKERKISIIPRAISLSEFEKNKDQYKGMNIVFYCTVGYRSSQVAEKYSKDFRTHNLSGGILGWVKEGHDVLREDKEVKEVHVYSEEFNYLPAKFTAVTN